jgi:tetratricopeptide (TPR) repeat protein
MKRKLPALVQKIPSDAQRARLARWLNARVAMTHAQEHAEAESVAAADVPASGFLRVDHLGKSWVRPYDSREARRGEVRLLSSRLVPGAERPVYVLVLADWEEGVKLVAPFGPLPEPATGGELALPGRPLPLQVLCAWNARTVPTKRLVWSWVVDFFEEEELSDAWAVFKHAATGAPLEAALETRVGLPIFKETDPRIAYQDEEVDLLAPLLAQDLPGVQDRVIEFPLPVSAPAVLAAETVSRRVEVVRFECPQRSVVLSLFCRVGAAQTTLVLHTPAGDPASGWDGAELLLPWGAPIGRFSGACAEVASRDLLQGVVVRLRDEVLPFCPANVKASPVPAGSFAGLLEEASDPEAPATFSDAQLSGLFLREDLPVSLRAALAGEILVRLWLYRAGEPGDSLLRARNALDGALREEWESRMATDGVLELPRNPFPAGSFAHEAWSVFARRAARFLRADGFIPALVGSDPGEAIPLPFRFQPGQTPDRKVTDLSGVPVPQWSEGIRRLEAERGHDLGLVLDVELGAKADRLEGGSLGLPVLVAHLRFSGEMPAILPLGVVASGEVVAGLICRPSGAGAKAALARRMGAVCLVPSPAVEGGLFPEGVPVGELPAHVRSALGVAKPGFLSARGLLDALRVLGEEIRGGRVRLEQAHQRLGWIVEALETQPPGAALTEANLMALVLQSAIANHQGNAPESDALLREARSLASQLKNPQVLVDASAHQVVCLTDLGYLEEAEHIGRDLLHWVRSQMQGDADSKTRAEMVACGVLGGQALLHAAVAGEPCGDESLSLLQSALHYARELQDPREICRDAVQIAGWHALLNPEGAEKAWAEARDILAGHLKKFSAVSEAYLNRVRFLGAYRRWLTSGEVEAGFAAWDLPSPDVAHAAWPLASALRCRGALLAASGALREADEDFARATSLLQREAPPVLRFMGAVCHVQAAISLRAKSPDRAEFYLRNATGIFEGFVPAVCPALDGRPWLEACLAWKTDPSSDVLRDLIRRYPF